MDHMYKSQLQSYAMKQNMELPVYAAERQGPAHAPRFRCKVTVFGQTFHGLEFCPTLKAAEHAAAKVALASLTPLNPEGVVDVAYKNLLQEIAQKENALLPVYGTSTSGPSHAPTFTSTVEFAGNLYKGEEAKTKKLAEMNAAKVAFMSIKYGQPNYQTPSSPSLPFEKQEAASSNGKSSEQGNPSQPSKMVTPDVPSKWIEVHEDELPDVLTAPANSVKDISIAASPVATDPTKDATLTAVPATNPMEMMDVAAADLHQNPTCSGKESLGVEESEKKLVMGSGYQNIPSGQHVVCRPWNSEMTLPEDAEMLFRDDRFIAYRVVKE